MMFDAGILHNPSPRLLLPTSSRRRSSCSWMMLLVPPNHQTFRGRRLKWQAAVASSSSLQDDKKLEGNGDGNGNGNRYERVAMGSAGAYRLVDRTTGQSVIVWGDEASSPTDKVLSYTRLGGELHKKDTKNHNKGGEGGTPTATDDNSSASAVPRVGTFSRLNSGKVKALIKRSHETKENSNVTAFQKAHETSFEDDDDDDDPLEDLQLRKRKIVSGSRKEQKFSDNAKQERIRDSGSLPVDSRQKVGTKGLDMPSSKVSSHSRGWGMVSDSTVGRSSESRNTIKDSGFFSRKSFKDIGCSDDIMNCLRSLMFIRPSHIQAMTYGAVLKGKSCIIADQSGSGKTLAYLAPVIQSLRQEEILGLGKSSSRSPRVVILAPTSELASQVLNNCRSISKFGVPFRSMVATGGFRQKTQLDSLEQELDVLIATPGRFAYLLQEGFVHLTNLRCVVLDEVDILFGGEGFEEVLQRLISVAPITAQYLFVTATLPVNIYNKVVQIFPDCEVIMGPGIHRTSSRLEEVLVDCSGDDEAEKSADTAFANKKSALVKILEGSPVPKTIVFCNKIETCRKVENVLKRFDRKGAQTRVFPFHSALEQEVRLANMKEFLSSQSADSMFLVCTDRASRGIDFKSVDHVVLFDFPRDPSEYVRRVGRTARGAGGRGKAYVFVIGKQVSLARRIMERNRKGHPLHDVPCS